MKRQIKKYGNTVVIPLKTQDLLDRGWNVLDWLDLTDIKKIKSPVKKKK